MDTTLSVRPRSALGLKYVELIPGRAEQDLPGRRHDPAPQRDAERSRARGRALDVPARDARGRADSRCRASATRSPAADAAINTTIRELEPFTRYLLPVMRNLSTRRRSCAGFFPASARRRPQVAPVAEVQARWFGEHGRPRSRRSGAIPRRCARRSRRARRRFRPRPSRSGSRRRSSPASPTSRATSSRAPRSCRATLPLVNDALQAGVPAFRADPAARRGPGGPVPGGSRTWATTRTRCSR